MEENEVIRSLSALAQPIRLRLFRALVVAGPSGLTPSVLAEELAVTAAVISFHLKELSHAGLISHERSGRFLIYRACFDRMNGVLAYLSDHCCEGNACLDIAESACSVG